MGRSDDYQKQNDCKKVSKLRNLQHFKLLIELVMYFPMYVISLSLCGRFCYCAKQIIIKCGTRLLNVGPAEMFLGTDLFRGTNLTSVPRNRSRFVPRNRTRFVPRNRTRSVHTGRMSP